MEAEYALIMFSDQSQTVSFAKLNSIKDTKCMLYGTRGRQADSGPQSLSCSYKTASVFTSKMLKYHQFLACVFALLQA